MIRPSDPAPEAPPESIPAPPRPVLKKERWPFPLIWLVPLFAAILAGYYFYDHLQDRGPLLSVTFADVGGLSPEQTPVTVHGVPVGKLESLSLDDHHRAIANLRLQRKFSSLAKSNTRFWIVRPEVSQESVTGLGTLVSGPYIEALPADGSEATIFTGLDHPPRDIGDGLQIYLYAARLDHLSPGSAIIYRGIRVGVVQDADLSSDSAAVKVRALIFPRYTKLVRANSRFWSTSGAEFRAGIVSGVHVRVDSLGALINGSVTFATPDDIGPQSQNGATFDIFSEPKKDWLEWSPTIMLPDEKQ